MDLKDLCPVCGTFHTNGTPIPSKYNKDMNYLLTDHLNWIINEIAEIKKCNGR